MYSGFSENNNILTPDGLLSIKEVTPGTRVYSFNQNTTTWETDEVVEVKTISCETNLVKLSTRCGFVEICPLNNIIKLQLGNFHKYHGYEKFIVNRQANDILTSEYIVQPTALKSSIDLKQTIVDIKPIVESLISLYTPTPKLWEEDGILWIGHGHYLKPFGITRYMNLFPLVEILAWYTAEGYSKKDCYTCKNDSGYKYSSKFCQSLKANLDKCELIKQSIKEASIRVKYSFSKILFNGIPKEMNITLCNIFSLLTQSCGCWSDVKTIPQWLMDILLHNADLREQYLFTIGLGDGFNTEGMHSRGFCSNSESLIQKMITLIQLSGYHYTIHKRKAKTTYITYNKLGRKRCLIALGQAKFVEVVDKESIPYKGNIYQIRVKNNHNLLIGQYGQLLCCDNIKT